MSNQQYQSTEGVLYESHTELTWTTTLVNTTVLDAGIFVILTATLCRPSLNKVIRTPNSTATPVYHCHDHTTPQVHTRVTTVAVPIHQVTCFKLKHKNYSLNYFTVLLLVYETLNSYWLVIVENEAPVNTS